MRAMSESVQPHAVFSLILVDRMMTALISEPVDKESDLFSYIFLQVLDYDPVMLPGWLRWLDDYDKWWSSSKFSVEASRFVLHTCSSFAWQMVWFLLRHRFVAKLKRDDAIVRQQKLSVIEKQILAIGH